MNEVAIRLLEGTRVGQVGWDSDEVVGCTPHEPSARIEKQCVDIN